MQLDRKHYLDIVRIFAIFLVLFTHTGEMGNKIYIISNSTIKQFLYCLLDCFRTINNPLLFMVSGALLLGKTENLKTIWRKRILRFIIVLFVFSFISVMYSYTKSWSDFFIEFSLIEFIKSVIAAPVQVSYWYLYAYISFLIMLPFVRKLASIPGNIMFYLIVVLVIVNDVFTLLGYVLGLSSININIGNWLFVPFYPICGYYFDNNWDKIKNKKLHWGLLGGFSIVGLLTSTYLTVKRHAITGVWDESSITHFDIIISIFVFVSIKEIAKKLKREKIISLLQKISSTMFGIYLLEFILKDQTVHIYHICDAYMPRIFACFIWLIITMMLGCVVVAILKKIPLIKKLI